MCPSKNSANSGGVGKSSPRNYQYFHLRLNKNSVNSQILTKVLTDEIGGEKILGQEEKGKSNGMIHFQITIKVKPKKTIACVVKKLKAAFPELAKHCFENGDPDKKEWYVQSSTGDQACWDYTAKEDTRVKDGWSCRVGMGRVIKWPEWNKWWQKEILEIITTEPDDRTIYWYWSTQKGLGKSTFCKYLVKAHMACLLDGKKNDIKNGALTYLKDRGFYPELCVWNIPAAVSEDKYAISYTALEQIKDALFYSGKYEGGAVAEPCPHVIVFANIEPNMGEIDPARFVIKSVNERKIAPEDNW